MAMIFCPKCKSILMPAVVNGKRVVKCPGCGYLAVGEEMKFSSAGVQRKELHVVEKENDPRVSIEAKCPKCKHTKAKHWTVQTRSADEPETRFYECEKCKHTWREYK